MDVDRKGISRLADKIRIALDMTTAPYDPAEAVEKLKGTILYDLPDPAIDATIVKVDEESFCIRLNDDRPSLRKRFTLAHELGHLFLHMGYLIDSEKWNELSDKPLIESVFHRDHNYSKEEYEANEFAAAFLMPYEEFLIIAEKNLKNAKYSIFPIADHFHVSHDAVSNRGKWLGIFQW